MKHVKERPQVGLLVGRIGVPSEVFIRRHVECLGANASILAKPRPPESEIAWGGELTAHLLPKHTYVSLRSVQIQSLMRYGNRRVLQGGTKKQKSAVLSILNERQLHTILIEYLDKGIPYLPDLIKAGKRVFGHAHGYDVSRLLQNRSWVRAYQRWNDAEGVIVPSFLIRERLARLGLEDRKLHVIRYGVEVPPTPPQTPEIAGNFKFVAVGRLIGKKSPLLTLEAFREVQQHVPDVELDMVGDGPLRAQVESYVTEHGLSQAVRVLGAQPHDVVRSLLGEAHAFIQHSRTDPDNGEEEGLPVGILEAMAQALPVVSTRHAGIPEAVAEGETGYLVDENDVQTMSEAMLQLVRNPGMGRSMGLAGWRKAAEHFSLEQNCVRLRKIVLGEEQN